MANAAALAPKITLGLPTPVETPAISGLPAAPPVQPSANLGLSKPPTANIGVGAAGTSGAVHSGFSPARSRLTGLSMLPVSPSRARLGGSFVPANHAQATAFRVHSSGVVMRHGPRR